MDPSRAPRLFYGWWIVLAAFLNLFFSVGLIYYGFPVFYPSLAESLGFTRGQLTAGFSLGFVFVAPTFGLFAGAMIDRVGASRVIRLGIAFVGVSMVLLGFVSKLWQYYTLCVTEVVGYVLAGPIPNQVLISNWFRSLRGRAMGYAYLGLGLGGTVSPVLVNRLIERFGWRRAFEAIGLLILGVLLPIAQWVTRSAPGELGLFPDGHEGPGELEANPARDAGRVTGALGSRSFWLILMGSTLTLFAIGTVSQHFVLFLKDLGFSTRAASANLSGLLVSSLAGRVIVGHLADRVSKKNVMALFYLILALAIPMLYFAGRKEVVWAFALVFGFAMGADYMLIPLVVADRFGLSALGKLLAIIIMTYSVAQFLGPVLAGKIFDAFHSYDLAWGIMTASGLLGAVAIYTIPEK